MPTPAPDGVPDPQGEPAAHGLPLPPALLALTVVSGIIDAVGYLALGHVFTANMTGNVAVLGFAVAGAPGFSGPRAVISLVTFLAGSVAGGWAGLRFARTARRSWVRLVLAVEAGMLSLSSGLALWAPGSATTTQYVLIAVTAVTMGLRNATVRRLGLPDLTTTVITMTLTGLGADSSLAGGRNVRMARRVASISALLGGAALGGWLVLHHGLWVALLSAAAVSGVLALTASARV